MDKPLPQRKNPRLQGYDYSLEGVYFVTICTHLRVHHFGHIANQEMCLNRIGEIAVSCWLEIPVHHPQVELDEFVVMPNHVHGTIVITDITDKKRATLGTIIGTFKAAVTRVVNRMSLLTEKFWQMRYHDHIIRNETRLNHIRQYVHYNPAMWEKDTFYG